MAAALVLAVSVLAEATGNFVTVKLPRGVSVELPKNWIVLSSNQRITLDTYVESALDLSGTEQEPSELPFAANLYDDRGRTIGIVNIRYYPQLELTQSDARATTASETQELDSVSKAQMIAEMPTFNLRVNSWLGTTKSEINGVTAFITEYRRAAKGVAGDFRVRLVRVFSAERSFTLTVSYAETSAIPIRPIADRIIASLRLVPAAEEPTVEPTDALASAGPVPSVMTQLYGESWALTLMISLLLMWGIGLAPPLIARFAILRRPMSKRGAVVFAVLFWVFNLLLFSALGSRSKTHFGLLLVAYVSYVILTRPARDPRIATG
ncbi:MAG: hypothetical protein ACR2HJ_05355 [Fimbriimonadales bacterium]